MPLKLTKDDFIKKSIEIHGDVYDYSEVIYTQNKIPVKIICSKHGEFQQTPNTHLDGCGCPRCYGRNKTTNEFIYECKLIHGDLYDYSLTEYTKALNRITIICSKHGEFKQIANKHLMGAGCPNCKKSKGEATIRKFLIENQIKYQQQKTFKDCKDKRLLAFDFYLPFLNICIEYDGRQHFEDVELWGGKNYLIDVQRKDKIKSDFCVENNINLIRISHKDDIKEKLNNLIFINKGEICHIL